MFNKNLNPKKSFVQHSAKCVKNQKIIARCENSANPVHQGSDTKLRIPRE